MPAMSVTFRTVLLWMALLVVIFFAWHFANIQRREDAMVFSDLLASVEAGEVRWVAIDVRGSGPGAVFRVGMTDGRRLRATGLYSDGVLELLRAAEVPFSVGTGETPAWANMLISWAPFLLLIGFWVFFMRAYKSGGINLQSARQAVAVRLDREEPRVSPAGLSGGAAAALAELRGLVRAEPPAPVLLTGPSGSGKTHLLRALATDLASPCLLADGASFAEIFMGVPAARVRSLFDEGRKQRVAFVAIDSIDDICHRRTLDSRGDRDERTQAMLQLSASLDGIAAPAAGTASFLGVTSRPKAAFAFVGVTNRPDLIDPAILQRFARVVTLGPPDLQERASILAGLLSAAGAPETLDLRDAASRTEGWTRGDLRICVDDVVRMAAGRRPSAGDLDAALAARERVRGLLRPDPA
jgi:cell division protease FtsH